MPAGTAPKSAPLPRGRDLGAVLRLPGVLVMGLTNAVLIAVQTGVVVFLFPLYLLNRGHVDPGMIGLVVSLGVLGRLLALWIVGNIREPSRRARILPVGLLAYAVVLAAVTLLTHPAPLALCSLALGSAAGVVAPLPTAILGDAVAAPQRGPAVGWLRTMTDGGQILGPLMLGALADTVDLSTPFVVGAAVLVASVWPCRRHARVTSVSPGA
jgi:MFS family permease